jgi:predicted nucleotidyltransferase component of viral defense system
MSTGPDADGRLELTRWTENPAQGQEEFRRAVHIILSAIRSDERLRETMIMKGGILMALRYHSPRFTTDIDFSTGNTLAELQPDDCRARFESALALAAAESDYDLDCRLQGWKIQPPNRPDASFPSIRLTIGYSPKGTPRHRRLLHGECPTVIHIDFSLNEAILATETLTTDGGSILAYAFTDLVAEKFRSLLQQPSRNRFRRQDVYDLAMLLARECSPEVRAAILHGLRAKARARDIDPGVDSISDPEVRRRAEAHYATLADEIEGELPDFDASYDRIERFYRSLPW